MSNAYLEFYFEVPLPSQEVANEVSALLDLGDQYWDADPDRQEKLREELSKVFSEFAEYEELGFQWNIHERGDARTLCITGEESGNTEHATELLLWLLPKTDFLNLGFSYAEYGDGHYGGGAVRVFMNGGTPEAEYMNTETWLAGVMR